MLSSSLRIPDSHRKLQIPLSSSGTPDILSTCLGTDSLTPVAPPPQKPGLQVWPLLSQFLPAGLLSLQPGDLLWAHQDPGSLRFRSLSSGSRAATSWAVDPLASEPWCMGSGTSLPWALYPVSAIQHTCLLGASSYFVINLSTYLPSTGQFIEFCTFWVNSSNCLL